jgi:hypothetical protein
MVRLWMSDPGDGSLMAELHGNRVPIAPEFLGAAGCRGVGGPVVGQGEQKPAGGRAPRVAARLAPAAAESGAALQHRPLQHPPPLPSPPPSSTGYPDPVRFLARIVAKGADWIKLDRPIPVRVRGAAAVRS